MIRNLDLSPEEQAMDMLLNMLISDPTMNRSEAIQICTKIIDMVIMGIKATEPVNIPRQRKIWYWNEVKAEYIHNLHLYLEP